MKNKDFRSFFKVPYPSGEEGRFGSFSTKPDLAGVAALMDYHRKNLKTFATVQQMMLDGMQVITRSVSVMASDLAESQADLARVTTGVMGADQQTDDQLLVLKEMMDRAATHFYEISDIAHQSSRVTADVMRARLSDSLTDLQKVVKNRRARPAA